MNTNGYKRALGLYPQLSMPKDQDSSGALSLEEMLQGYDRNEDFQKRMQVLGIGLQGQGIVFLYCLVHGSSQSICDCRLCGVETATEFIPRADICNMCLGHVVE